MHVDGQSISEEFVPVQIFIDVVSKSDPLTYLTRMVRRSGHFSFNWTHLTFNFMGKKFR